MYSLEINQRINLDPWFFVLHDKLESPVTSQQGVLLMAATSSNLKAVALISGEKNIKGSINFIQETNGVTHVRGKITGLSPGLHGFHIHAMGDTTNGCNSTGPHYNPLKKNHGAPCDGERHAGDLGNIVAGPDGVAEIYLKDMQPKPLKNINTKVCQICGDTVGVTASGDVFVVCNECAFPICRPCYEKERKVGNQSCPQCTTRYKRHKDF